MEKDNICYKTYVEILERELVPAMGCTEPIALAYCSAKARSVLGVLPDKVLVEVSGNIVKNVKSVIVPNSGAGELRRQQPSASWPEEKIWNWKCCQRLRTRI